MNKKLFLMFMLTPLFLFTADDQFYSREELLSILNFDDTHDNDDDTDLYWMNFDAQDTPEFFNLQSPVDDEINYFLEDVKKKQSIERIIGKDVETDRTPRQNLIIIVNSWKRMPPEEFEHNFNILEDITRSDDYNHVPELKNACKKITKFIWQFIKMPLNSLQAQYFVEDNAFAWQQWANTIHMYL